MADIPTVEVFTGEKKEGFLMVTATATVKDEDGNVQEYRKATIPYKFGADLDEATKLHTKEVVFEKFLANSKVRIQGLMRAILAGDDPERVEEITNMPIDGSFERVPRDPVSAGEAAFERMSDEQRDAFLKMIAAKAAAGE
jgi:hypothetical protein